jgi:Flp pilus assembly protein TadG
MSTTGTATVPERPRRTAAAMLRDLDGATLIEFAILAPIFIALLLGIFQVSIVLFTQQLMQTAVEESARMIAVGAPQKANKTQAAYRTDVCGKLPGFIKCANIIIDVRNASTLPALRASTVAPTVNSAGVVTPGSRYEPGGPGTYNMVRLMYVWSVVAMPPTFNLADAGPGRKMMVATTIVRVEPYNP